MTNKAERILLCVFAIPILVCMIIFLPYCNYIGVSIFAILFLLFAGMETSMLIYGKKNNLVYIYALIPLITYICPKYTEVFGTALVIMVLFLSIVFSEKNGFDNAISNISKDVFLIIYPFYLGSYFIRICSLNTTNSYTIMFYFLLVFTNDIFAYVFGMLFGKTNNNILKTSPKKSIAGFVGGFISTIALAVFFFMLFSSKLNNINLTKVIILAVLMSIFGNIGDLAESVLKRCAKVKDSGSIIPGRGGFLDCTDSILTTAMIFYYFVK